MPPPPRRRTPAHECPALALVAAPRRRAIAARTARAARSRGADRSPRWPASGARARRSRRSARSRARCVPYRRRDTSELVALLGGGRLRRLHQLGLERLRLGLALLGGFG